MKLEEFKQIIFLSEHGYYDEKVMKLATKNKSKDIDYYVLRGDEIVVYHDGGICGYYGQQNTDPNFGKDLLRSFRKNWLEKNFPEIKKLLERGD